MKRIFLAMVSCVLLSISLSAQIKVATNNNVGVGEEDPVSKFAIGAPGTSYITAYIEPPTIISDGRTMQVSNPGYTGSWGRSALFFTTITSGAASKNVGIHVQAYSSTVLSSKRSYGIVAYAGNCTSGYNYAVKAKLSGSNNGAAIFGVVPNRDDINVSGIYAGYFRGDVKMEDDLTVNGVFTDSDIELKKEIRMIKDEGVSQLEKIKSLNSIKYKLKTPNEIDLMEFTSSDTTIVISEALLKSEKFTRDNIGLSAQELQKVYPELVKEGSNGFLSVNYIGLVPVLVEAIKEQDVSISKYESQLNVQSKELARQAEEIAELRKLVEGLLSTEKE